MTLKVQLKVVGQYSQERPTWPASLPVPSVGDPVEFQFGLVYVREVVWYPDPTGDAGELTEPFAYVILGAHR